MNIKNKLDFTKSASRGVGAEERTRCRERIPLSFGTVHLWSKLFLFY